MVYGAGTLDSFVLSTNQRINESTIRSEEVDDFEKIWLWADGVDAVCLKC